MEGFEDLLPLDKSYYIRRGLLDIMHGEATTVAWLLEESGVPLSDDLQALVDATYQWLEGSDTINVGESGTLYRFLQFLDWTQGGNRTFIKEGTLANRSINVDPSIVDWPIESLIKLDGGTSQWASAATLVLNIGQSSPQMPRHFNMSRGIKLGYKPGEVPWEIRYDPVIKNLVGMHLSPTSRYKMSHFDAEYFCFLYAFDMITLTEGFMRWPQMVNHESNRFMAMEKAMQEPHVVDVADHRVVQAMVMRFQNNVTIAHPQCVSKTWPQFWDYMRVI